MTEFYNFGDYVFPICRLHLNESGKYNIKHFHGSGFFIGGDGYFLSAKHVINNEDVKEITSNTAFGLILQDVQDNGLNRFTKTIICLEEHPKYDVVIGKVDHAPEKFFSSNNQDAYGWEDVHCFGYPDDLNKNHEQKYAFGSQFLKGYIMRRISKEDIPFLNIPPSYELNFPIPKGISGSPIFRIGSVKSLLGIALASHDSVLSRYESTEVLDGNEKYSEKTVQVKQVGIAARAFEIRDWKPSILNGLALKDIY
ncbi:MAG: serine protease [Desulfocapsaceae bacterium]|nr:serine protease [Desulfocapsaceae bacterium]